MSDIADLPLFAAYPESPGYKVHGPSAQAAASMEGRAARLRDRVLALIEQAPSTADECASVLGESVLSIRPRLSELVKMGLITDSGFRRPNTSGRSATVWKPIQDAEHVSSSNHGE